MQGVLFAYTENSRIENVTVSNNDYSGIYLGDSSNNTLTNNTANSNNYCGIYLYDSNNNTLQSNTANLNYHDGIYLRYSSNNTLQSNTMSGNEWNFGVYGRSLSDNAQNIDTSNMVDGKPIYYWVGQQSRQIPVDAGFVGVINSTNITVRDVALTNNVQGVLFAYTENSRIENVTASNSKYGISLEYSTNNTLTGNTASDNDQGICLWESTNNTLQGNNANSNIYDGIYMRESTNNTLTNNIVNSNNYGIRMSFSSDYNTIYHNNLINNTDHNAYDSGTNPWDSGSEGNYYSDYTSTDPDGNGIGSDPHPIPGGNSTDRFPLMQPWTPPLPQKGNLNGDDRITPADAAIALAIAAGGSASCDATTLAAADVSSDNRVTSLDALMILQVAARAIEL